MVSTLNVHKSSLFVGGGNKFRFAMGILWRANAAYAQSCKQLKYSLSTFLYLSHFLSVSDMITIFHARARYKFRFVTVEIAGTLIKLPVEGECEKVSSMEQGEEGTSRGLGNCLVCKRITSHMLCHKKINNVMTNV